MERHTADDHDVIMLDDRAVQLDRYAVGRFTDIYEPGKIARIMIEGLYPLQDNGVRIAAFSSSVTLR